MTPNQSEVKLKQKGRLISLKVPALKEDELVIEHFSGTEELSRPYEFKLELLSTNLSIDMKKLLRKPATVNLQLAGETQRYFHGFFSSFRQKAQTHEDYAVYEAVLVPSIWFLSLDQDCRIFQNQSVPDIVQAVLKGAGVTDIDMRVGSYPKRDYCVQYRESNLNFISRLLEDEGIFYYFVHEESKHTLTVRDRSENLVPCPDQEKASYGFSAEAAHGMADGIWSFERIEQVHSGKVTLRDYDFEKPKISLETTLSTTSEAGKEEVYNYPGTYFERSEGDRYARLRLEERETRQFVGEGTSRCRAFRPGYKFKLDDHYRKDTNQEYVLISVAHDILDTTYRVEENPAHRYENSFRAIPKTVPYRPPLRTVKPFVQGSQTAVVVGPSGDEIFVDKYSRVKVQFFWDRIGKKNESSSCWIRVAQIWAGKNWGWVTIPRIGQEVLIDFLEGDPDRPIITGRVYNDDQMPPYTLPGNQTQSGIKSRSSKQGGTSNYNEIRFEDLKDSEMITVHAEKDMETEVEHDDKQTVQNDRTIKVDGKHTETIKKDTTITITEGNKSLTINQGNQSTTLDQGNQSTTLKMGNQSIKLSMGNQSTKLDLGKAETEAMQSIELKVGQSSIKIDQMGVTIKGMMIKVDGQIMTEVKAGVLLTAKGAITMIN